MKLGVLATLAKELTMPVHPDISNLDGTTRVESNTSLEMDRTKTVVRCEVLHLVVVHGSTLPDGSGEVKGLFANWYDFDNVDTERLI